MYVPFNFFIMYLNPRINRKVVFFGYIWDLTSRIDNVMNFATTSLACMYLSKYLVSICIVNRRLLESVISQRMMFVVYVKYYYDGGWDIATYWESGYFLVLYSIRNQHQRENIKSKYDWKRKLSQAINHVQYMKILLSKCHQNYKVWYLLYTKLWF